MSRFTFDTTIEQRDAMLKKLMREPGMLKAFFGETESGPLALEICTDDGEFKPIRIFDIGKLLRHKCNHYSEEGYQGSPDIKATRDALEKLVGWLDKWDATIRRRGRAEQ